MELRYLPQRYLPERYLPERYLPERHLPKRDLPKRDLPEVNTTYGPSDFDSKPQAPTKISAYQDP
ncbi:MAG: hypothetical protein JNL67_22840 [Planctomycetaceae bacterium]|nr:hypothetical protein [Planctomycetaceae bacterium]